MTKYNLSHPYKIACITKLQNNAISCFRDNTLISVSDTWFWSHKVKVKENVIVQ